MERTRPIIPINRPVAGHHKKAKNMKLFVSYQVNVRGDSVFGNTVVDTATSDKVTYQDIRAAEAKIRDAFKTVGATVLSFQPIDG